MAYTKKVPAVATAVLFLAVVIAPLWSEAQSMPKIDPVCAFVISDIVKLCYLSGDLTPSEECCKDLKSANEKQVTCLCDNIVAHPSNNTIAQALLDVVHSTCGVSDKLACKGDANGGATNKIATSMGLFGLVASLFF